ncbi:hypothetical protein LEMLEM_LOCUS6664, partial [Lemmus lemmus]
CVLNAPSSAGGSIWGSGAQTEAGRKGLASGSCHSVPSLCAEKPPPQSSTMMSAVLPRLPRHDGWKPSDIEPCPETLKNVFKPVTQSARRNNKEMAHLGDS